MCECVPITKFNVSVWLCVPTESRQTDTTREFLLLQYKLQNSMVCSSLTASEQTCRVPRVDRNHFDRLRSLQRDNEGFFPSTHFKDHETFRETLSCLDRCFIPIDVNQNHSDQDSPTGQKPHIRDNMRSIAVLPHVVHARASTPPPPPSRTDL